MGFFKNIQRNVSGSSAKVSLKVSKAMLNKPVSVSITAETGDADIHIKKVYLWVKSIEKVRINGIWVYKPNSENVEIKDFTNENEIYPNSEFVFERSKTLIAKETYNWQKEIKLFSAALPTYIGKNAFHSWYFLAGLNSSGTDPSSGWIEVNIF